METPIAEHRMMRLIICTFFVCISLTNGFSQEPEHASWQLLWQEMMEVEEAEDAANQDNSTTADDNMALLQQLADNPIDINTATYNDLIQMPFLSAQQVMDILGYRDSYRPVRSMGEMRMIRSLDFQQVELLKSFVYVGEESDTLRFPSLNDIAARGRHELSGSLSVPFYERRGDRNGYLGYRYRHWLHYDFHYSDYVRFGLFGSQDAGEPFFSNRNAMGYDSYSYYLQLRKLGIIQNLVIGKYKVATGLGLVLNNSFKLGKMALLQTKGRQSCVLTPNATGSVADYMQGAAASLLVARNINITAYASYRPIDATLNDDHTAATIIVSGYHRTPKEMAKKHNTHAADLGTVIGFSTGGLRLGAAIAYTHLDRRLVAYNGQKYRRYFPSGSHFLNGSLSYSFMHHRFSVSGETAVDKEGHVATVNILSYEPQSSWSVVAAQRFYSYRYATLHGHAFSEGSRVQNESGVYVGATWQPFWRLQLKGYADLAYFPWARYRVSRPSRAQDYTIDATYKLTAQWQLQGRYRLHRKQLDNTNKTALRPYNTHNSRLILSFDDGTWAFTTRGDYAHALNGQLSDGWMVSENVALKSRVVRAALMAAYFNTDSYDSRLYVHEQQLAHNFSSLALFGRGLRLSMVVRTKLSTSMQLQAKLGFTKYFDRSEIGSGLQQIDASHMTNLDLQARWRF